MTVAPMTPPECDLRGMPFMPVDLVRLFDSDLYALSSGDEFKAAFTLWGKAFLQVPAGSLPTDDRILAHLSGAGAGWRKVKAMALRGWIEASDGRLYHPVVAEKARDAWEARLAQRARTEAARAARAQRRQGSDNPSHGTPTDTVASSVTDNVTGSKGQGQGQGQGIKESPLTPTAGAVGGSEQFLVQSRPPRGSRADGTNPRAVAAAERAAAAPEPASPFWPAFRGRGVPLAEFRAWIEPLVAADGIDGRTVLVAPTRFHADHVRREYGPHLEAAANGPVDVREAPPAMTARG